jgi:hypothetical protein
MLMLVALIGGAFGSCFEVIRALMETGSTFPISLPATTWVRWIIEPYFLLNAALFMLAASMCYRIWIRGGNAPPISVPRIEPDKFAACLAGLLVISATGIPMLAAFGFALWFSPLGRYMLAAFGIAV